MFFPVLARCDCNDLSSEPRTKRNSAAQSRRQSLITKGVGVRTRFLILHRAAFAALLVGLAIFQSYIGTAHAASGNRGPEFTVDADSPEPMPHKWLVGDVAGAAVDGLGRIRIIQRPSTLSADEAGAEWTPRRSECRLHVPSAMRSGPSANLFVRQPLVSLRL